MPKTLEEIRANLRRRKAANVRKSAPNPRTERTLRKAAEQINPGSSLDPQFMRTVRDLARSTKAMAATQADLQNRLRYAERALKRRSAAPAPRVSLPGVEDGGTFKGKKQKFMFTRAIRYILTGREEGSEFEAEVIRQTEKRASLQTRALEAGSDTLGGFLVPNQIISEMVELIRAQAVVIQAGATVMGGLVGSPIQIPKQTSASTAYWVGENVAPDESSQAFGQLTMSPHTCAAYTKISKRLIMLSNPSAEAVVREDLSLQLALKMDLAMLRGGAAAGEPVGIANSSGIGTYAFGTNGGPLTYQDLVKIVAVARNANALRNSKSLGWILPSALISVLMQLVDGNNRPLLSPWTEGAADWAPGEPGYGGPVGRLLGYPVYDTTQIPTNLTKGTGTSLTEIYFGDIGTLLVGQWGGITIEASGETSTAFLARQVWVLIAQDVDFAIRQPERLVYSNDVQGS